MKSHEVMRLACDVKGSKEVAAGMGVCHSLVNKWSEARWDGRSVELNPLDRVVLLLDVTGDLRLLHWICEQKGGYFTPYPPPCQPQPAAALERLNRLEAGLLIFLRGGELTLKQYAQLRRDLAELSGDYHQLLKDYAARRFGQPKPPAKPKMKSKPKPTRRGNGKTGLRKFNR